MFVHIIICRILFVCLFLFLSMYVRHEYKVWFLFSFNGTNWQVLFHHTLFFLLKQLEFFKTFLFLIYYDTEFLFKEIQLNSVVYNFNIQLDYWKISSIDISSNEDDSLHKNWQTFYTRYPTSVCLCMHTHNV